MNPVETLANEIIVQAAKDYMKALAILKRNPRNKEARYTKRECEHFFRSNWYKMLTSLNEELLISKLKEVV